MSEDPVTDHRYEGHVVGPVRGPNAIRGQGYLDLRSDGVAWLIRRRFRGESSGVVPWSEITSLEVGVESTGGKRSCIAFVSYGAEAADAGSGFLGLSMPNTPENRARVLDIALRAELFMPVDHVHADFPS
jgi:hypothetical protein